MQIHAHSNPDVPCSHVHNATVLQASAKHVCDLNDELVSAGVLLLCQVFSAGLEVVKDVLLVAVGTAIVPLQAVLPSTSACKQAPVLAFPACFCIPYMQDSRQ